MLTLGGTNLTNKGWHATASAGTEDSPKQQIQVFLSRKHERTDWKRCWGALTVLRGVIPVGEAPHMHTELSGSSRTCFNFD